MPSESTSVSVEVDTESGPHIVDLEVAAEGRFWAARQNGHVILHQDRLSAILNCAMVALKEGHARPLSPVA
jgi:hypothetical protein